MILVLNNLKIYAYHGVIPQEQIVGDWYKVNLRLIVTNEKSTVTDNIGDTINYAEVYEVVREEMAIPSKLIEHVCGRIARRLLDTYRDDVEKVSVSIYKQTPPITGIEGGGCGVELEVSRKIDCQ